MSTALEARNLSLFDVPGCQFTATALEIEPGMSFDHWRRLGDALRRTERGIQFWIGDYFAYGATYGEASSQAANDWTGYTPATLWNLTFVSEKVKSSRRREDLSWRGFRVGRCQHCTDLFQV